VTHLRCGGILTDHVIGTADLLSLLAPDSENQSQMVKLSTSVVSSFLSDTVLVFCYMYRKQNATTSGIQQVKYLFAIFIAADVTQLLSYML